MAPVKRVPPAKVMSSWRGGTGIAKFAGAAPFMTAQLTAVQEAVPSKVVPPAKVMPLRRHHYRWCHPPCQGVYYIKLDGVAPLMTDPPPMSSKKK